MPRICLAALVLGALAGCGTPIPVRDPANALLGKPEADVVEAFGRNYTTEPNDDQGAVDGRRLVYVMTSTTEALMYGNPLAFLVRSPCTVIFTLDRGTVKYTTLRGSGCR